MNGKEKYMVCTRCITYNQASYIKDAMCGFTMQVTSFPFISVIIDDASTDHTAAEIAGFLSTFFDFSDESAYKRDADFGKVFFAPHRHNRNCYFAVILLKENHYSRRKPKLPYFDEWIRESRYVAVCEGDDYWTDPEKLQKQVDVLEENKDVLLCCSSCAVNTNEKLYQEKRYPTRCVVPPKDIILGGGLWLHTVTYMYRKALTDNYPVFCWKCHVGDYPLILWASLNGDVFYIPEATAVYRYQSSGSWTQRQKSMNIDTLIRGWRSEVDMLEGLNDWSNHQHSAAFRKRIAFYLYDQMLLHKREINRIIPSFREEMRLFSRKQRMHIFFTRMHLGFVFPFLLNVWHTIKRLYLISK